ncbi:hypothetical protein [Ochrovirga pacifica]|uniref:hypothetical protein n=1 Tax=Ochrovirga pacifica TaxID=1042376 RepID=UPI000497B40B|nr:hypothetical protein [Ochrovirga pacifica]
MKSILLFLSITMLFCTTSSSTQEGEYKNDSFKINNVSVQHQSDLEITIWEINVDGVAGKTIPTKVGQLDGAPVLGYVFPTSLKPNDVGFSYTEGIVALAITSHPDFDDTPLWDENSDSIFDNDGYVWHPHWVVLCKDKRVAGGLAVKQFDKEDNSVKLPPTNPGMPMYMDSPGFSVITKNNTIKIIVPDYRINNQTDFTYDGVTAFMKVNTKNKNLPMLGVYEVFSVASDDLSMPYKVKN